MTISDQRPHSRACGMHAHDHGPDCHTNCPTCQGNPIAVPPLYAKDDPLARLRTTIAVATVTEKFATTIDQDLAAQVKMLLDEHDARASFRPPPEHKQTVAVLGHDLTRALRLIQQARDSEYERHLGARWSAKADALLAEYADGA